MRSIRASGGRENFSFLAVDSALKLSPMSKLALGSEVPHEVESKEKPVLGLAQQTGDCPG